MFFARLWRHLAQQHQWALNGVSLDVVKRPHVLVFKAQVRLLNQCLAIGTQEAQVFDGVGKVPAVVALFPFAAPAEATHCWRRTTFVLVCEGDLVGPVAHVRAVGKEFAVDFVHNNVFTNQAGNHAAPAAVRVNVAAFLVKQHVGFARNALSGIPLPVVTKLCIPTRVLVLKPLKVAVGLRLNAPEINRPAN